MSDRGVLDPEMFQSLVQEGQEAKAALKRAFAKPAPTEVDRLRAQVRSLEARIAALESGKDKAGSE